MRLVQCLPMVLAVAAIPMPAGAQYNGPDALRSYNRQAGPTARESGDRRDWRTFRNYDYNRPEHGQRVYYADRYYRDGRNYRTRPLGRQDRIYRGNDDRYYCRRTDGTTGLIIGGLTGAALGNVIASGQSRLLGTLVGAGGGVLLGRTIDRGKVLCR